MRHINDKKKMYKCFSKIKQMEEKGRKVKSQTSKQKEKKCKIVIEIEFKMRDVNLYLLIEIFVEIICLKF